MFIVVIEQISVFSNEQKKMSTDDECPIVDCQLQNCRSKCGYLKWFGNLSDCDVSLEYRLPHGELWHSLGEFASGNHTEFGGGVLLLPSQAEIRAVKSRTETGTEVNEVIADWGNVGNGLPSLFIDNSMCTKSSVSGSAASPSVCSPSQPSSPQTTVIYTGAPNWLLWAGIVLALICLIMGILYIQHSQI